MRRDHLADDARDSFTPDVHLQPCGGDGDAPHDQLDDPCLFGREQLRPELIELMQGRDGVGLRGTGLTLFQRSQHL